MRIVYLRTSKPGLEWFLQYYGKVFPEGNVNAVARFDAMERLLEDNPHVGQRFGDGGARILPILRTPFGVVYRVKGNQIRVIKIVDYRSDKSRES
jgi:hypothetical protein